MKPTKRIDLCLLFAIAVIPLAIFTFASDENPPPKPDAPASIYCPICGTRNPAGSRFCLKDGSPLPALDPSRLEAGFTRALETYSSEEVQQAIHRASESVVRIRAKTGAEPRYPVVPKAGEIGHLEAPGGENLMVGSGFAIGEPGEIVTNAHVASPFGNEAELTVETPDGRSFPARVQGIDQACDLALLRVNSANLQPLVWADSDATYLGEETWAVGNPLDIGISLTRGTISTIARMRTGLNQIENFIHSDAFFTHGNSGGPMVDVLGRVVGVNDMVYGEEKGQGYSIPSNMANLVVGKLRGKGKYARGFIGVQVHPLDAQTIAKFSLKRSGGVVVESVLAETPAASAGFQPGDVIFGINGHQAAETYQLQEAISSVGPNAVLEIILDRAGKVMKLPVTTSERPKEPRIEPILDLERYLMAHFVETPGKRKGVTLRVTELFSLAGKYGLVDGDEVKSVLAAQDWPPKTIPSDAYRLQHGVVEVNSLDDLRKALRRAYLGGRVGVTFEVKKHDRVRRFSMATNEIWAIVI